MSQQAKNLIAQARTENWKRLDLGNCNLTDLQTQVPELFELQHLEELVLSNEWVEWDETTQGRAEKKSSNKGQANFLSKLPQAMAQLKQLKVLVCGGRYTNNWAISDLSFLQTLPQLTHLNLSFNKITQLENLDKLPNLQQLNLSFNKITQLENLDKLPNLQKLDISGNKITQLKNLDKLPNLQELIISDNEITQLENLDKLPNLQELIISLNQITQLENLDKLPKLQQLDISVNEITQLENLDKLPNLQELIISWNKITKIENTVDLPKLQQLDISVNEITQLENLDKLPNLQQLVIGDNKITQLENLDKLPNLQELVIGVNEITKLENLDKLPNLQQLVIGDNKITQLENLDKLPNLQQLVISHNQITKLENLDKLPNLQKLDISHNKITQLKNLDKLPNLQQLDISGNKITQLKNLDKLPNLQELIISGNKITQLKNLDKLPNLQELIISDNEITQLENLDKLPNLQKLDISENQITSDIDLAFLRQFPQLNDLAIRSNPLGNILPEVVQENNCLADLLRYLLDLEEGGQPNNEVKVLLIGNGNVGKTQVAKRLELQDSFVFDTQHNSTHAISLLQRQLPCRSLPIEGLLLNLWDFGGQDIYHATHRLFMRTRALFLLVWDKISETTPYHTWQGHDYKNEPLLYWLSYAQYFGENSPVLVVQNKIDAPIQLPDPYPDPVQNELKRLYPVIHDFVELSAKTGKKFVVLERVIAKVFEQTPVLKADLLDKKLPKTWVQVRNRIREEQAKPNGLTDITFATFEQWCREAKIPASAPLLARFLHDTGVIYYQGNYFAGRTILNQNWVISAVYKILDREGKYYELLEHNKGKLSYNDVCDIWQAHSDEERELFLNFMLSSELCFETTPDKNYNTPLQDRTFVIPQLLPEQEPDYIVAYQQGTEANQQKCFEYRFLPSVFIQRFIIKAHRFSDQQYMWQQGIGLEYKEGFAIVRASYAPYSITIWYNTAAQQNGLLQAIEEELQALENEDKNIPHPEHKKKGFDVLSLFIKQTMNHKQHLQQLVAQGKLKQAIEELLAATQQNGQSDLYNNIIHLSGRFHGNEGDKHNDVVSVDNYKLELNRISLALSSYLNEYRPNGSFVFTPQGDNNTQPVPNSTEKQTTPPKAAPKTILFLAANPSNASRVQTDKEYRIIKAELERGTHRDNYQFLLPQLSLTITELLRALNDKPNIVHFSGHGTTQGIAIVKDDNTHQIIPTESLKRLFRNAKDSTELVLLNACYSAEQAKVISEFGMYVIGNNLPIGDEAAISFAKGLYNGLSEGKTIEQAYNDAIIVLGIENPAYVHVVEVWKDGAKLDW
ncbi:MAG: leucine-rich repeat domain-containing protein [Chitinophagales bacterium]|nr:leucine-rich repeat domain-containing protein [Chitinophagales bacterium]